MKNKKNIEDIAAIRKRKPVFALALLRAISPSKTRGEVNWDSIISVISWLRLALGHWHAAAIGLRSGSYRTAGMHFVMITLMNRNF